MNIVLDGQRERVVDDKVHPRDVETPGRHISGHQQRDLPGLELLHRLRPPVLHNSNLGDIRVYTNYVGHVFLICVG